MSLIVDFLLWLFTSGSEPMPEPGARIYVLEGRDAADYTPAEIRYAAALAWQLAFTKLILVEPPAHQPTDDDADQ